MLKMKIFDVKNLEDENYLSLKQMFFIWNSLFESVPNMDRKINQRLSKFCGRRNKYTLRKLSDKSTKNKSKITKAKNSHTNPFIQKMMMCYNNIEKSNEGLLCFDGDDEKPENLESEVLEPPPESEPDAIDSISNPGSMTENKSLDVESIETMFEERQIEKEESPMAFQSMETPSFHNENPFSGLDEKLAQFLSKKPKGSLIDLKDTMKAKLYRRVFDENYMLTQIAEYQDFKKKRQKAIERQVKIMNRKTPKRIKKPTLIKKYFYIRKKKTPAWKDEIESSGTSITDLKSEPEEQEESIKSEIESASAKDILEESKDTHVCEDTDKSISCPSETDSEAPCKCSSCDCTCNEYLRFRKFLFKMHERDEKVEPAEEVEGEATKLSEANKNRWDDLCNLNEVSQWSEETLLEVSTTSGSSVCIVRKCHCSHCSCGCAEYREYLRYKLHQAASRRRKRNRRRAEKELILQRIIEENYKEDEYVRTVREFINKYYVQEAENERPNLCTCDLYNCPCEPEATDEKDEKAYPCNEKLHIDATNNEESKTASRDPREQLRTSREFCSFDENRKVRFGSESLVNSTGSGPSQKSTSSIGNGNRISSLGSVMKCIRGEDGVEGSEDIYAKLSRLFENSESNIEFNTEDYIPPDKEEEPAVVESDASSYGSFDYKKYLVENECDCQGFSKYMAHKTKTRRLAEKKDPILKYFRKRLLYMSSLDRAEKLLDRTSSETESPARVPAARVCEKHKFKPGSEERKRKIFKKKKRRLEKKVILEIIKKGNHLHPCKCNFSTSKKDKIGESLPICDECQVNLKFEDRKDRLLKTKIEPSIPLGDIEEDDCVFGYTRTFPECPICASNMTRIQFLDTVEHRIITDERESGESASMKKDAETALKDSLPNLGEEGKGEGCLSDMKSSVQESFAKTPKAGAKSKVTPAKKSKGKRKRPKKGKRSTKKRKIGKKKISKKGNKKIRKSTEKRKKKRSKKETHKVYYTQNVYSSEEEELDATVSLFDSRIVFKFDDFEICNE